MDKPLLLKGDMFIDARGTLRFVNDFDFKHVKRFYQVENHARGYIRAWHGHKKDQKYVYVASGSILIGAAHLETEELQAFILSAEKPSVLWIPANYANGFMTLQEDTRVIFFSTLTIQETKHDEIRFPYDKWNIWHIDYF